MQKFFILLPEQSMPFRRYFKTIGEYVDIFHDENKTGLALYIDRRNQVTYEIWYKNQS